MQNQELFNIAMREYGTKEIVGKNHNEEVVKYFKEIGFETITDDETAWCSAFANWCAMMAGVSRSKLLNARSWLDVGSVVKAPLMGDVVIFWRESKESWKGHVGFYIKETDGLIYTLGGNQKNMVSIAPYAKARLLGYRRLYPICEACKHAKS